MPFPVDSLPRFDSGSLPAFGRKVADATLAEHKRHVRRPTQRRTFDTRHIANVASALPGLPADGETWHLVAKGHTPFWGFIPRLIELAAEPIADLTISTLGFGRDFAEWLLDALAAGQVGQVGIACSTYFRATSQGEFRLLADRLTAPNRLAVTRSHAKVIAARMQSGRGFVFEGSGNLRSCRMAEQATISQDAELCRFHQEWITELINGQATDTAGKPQ